jgi:hypothetical protein
MALSSTWVAKYPLFINIQKQNNLDSKDNDSDYGKKNELFDRLEINRDQKEIQYKVLIFDQTNEIADVKQKKKEQEGLSHLQKQFEYFKAECVKDKNRGEIKEILKTLTKKEFSENESVILFVKCSGCDEWIKSSDLGFIKHSDFIEALTKNRSLENKIRLICISSINSFCQNVVSKYLINKANLIEKLDEKGWDEYFLEIQQTKPTELSKILYQP